MLMPSDISKITPPSEDMPMLLATESATKGVAKWSLNPDDNATSDALINWQEGQMPSTVNNSARAMMARIREEHDIVNDQLKAIKNSWGSNFLYVEVGSYTLKDNKDGTFTLNMVLSKKLTDEQYADFKAGKLQLAVYSSNDTLKDSVYKSLTARDVIILTLSIPTASTTPIWDLYVRLSFFGRRFETNRITIHELSYIVNNLMEYVAEKTDPPSNSLRTVRPIPMTRSYVDFKTVEVKDDIDRKLNVKLSWHYISPCEIILTVEPSGPIGANTTAYRTFVCDLGFEFNELTLLDKTTKSGVVNIFRADEAYVPEFSVASYYTGSGNTYIPTPTVWDGIRYRFYIKLTTDAHFNLYPMNRCPEPGKTYPIIT